MSKKILVICHHYWPENFRVTDLCQGLVERGYQVDVLCGTPNYPQGRFYSGYSYWGKKREVHNGVQIFRTCEVPRGSNTNLRIFLNYISFPVASFFSLPRFLSKRYDKVLIYQLSPVFMGIAGIIIGKIKKIEVTTYVLDLWPDNLYSVFPVKNRFLRNLLYKISTWFYKKSDKLIAVSPEMESLLGRRTGKKGCELTTIYQYCEKLHERKLVARTLRERFKGYFNVVYTGNITPAQSFETIIDTALLLKKRGYEKKIHFIIVGGGMSVENFKSAIQENQLGRMFNFEGLKPVEEMPKYYDIADALLVTLAKSDLLKLTIPAKVTSYIASGKPIIASLEGSGKVLIEQIGCGLVSSPEDSYGLQENILKLFEMKESHRAKMGKKGVDSHFKFLERNKSVDKIIQFLFH